MVSHAITSLDEEAGSSESSISKHIQSNYDDLPPAHDNLLHYHLSKLTRLGEILQLSPGFYTLPHSHSQNPNPNPNPPHGRSSKLPWSTEPYKEKHRTVDNDPVFDVEERGSATVRKGRGRPRKVKPAGHEKSGGPALDAGGGEVGLFPTEGAVEGGDGLIRGRLPKAKIRKDGDGVLRLEVCDGIAPQEC